MNRLLGLSCTVLSLLAVSLESSAVPVVYTFDFPGSWCGWRVTITGDDGETSASETVTLDCSDNWPFSGTESLIGGNFVGIVDPILNPNLLAHSIDRAGVALTVGVLSVTFDLIGRLAWSPSGTSLMTGGSAFMPTGDATAANFQGALSTGIGDFPINVGLPDHIGGDMAMKIVHPGHVYGDPLVEFEDHNRITVSNNRILNTYVELVNSYEAVIGRGLSRSVLNFSERRLRSSYYATR